MIVAAGDGMLSSGTGTGITYIHHSVIARFTANGSLDTSFASGGMGTNVVGTTSGAVVVKVQPNDGKIVVGGNFQNGSGPASFYITRFHTDGAFDTSFGSSGTAMASLGTNAVLADIVTLPGGKILAAGTTNIGTDDVFLMRFNSDGTPDVSFGFNGTVISDDSGHGAETAAGIAVQTDGRIVVAATFHPLWGVIRAPDFALFRYNANGVTDAAIGNGSGMVRTDFRYDDYVSSVLIQPDGKIVLIGSIFNGSDFDIGLVRYWP
jgi:uncharacterized delta-60 repeat protein